MGKNKANSIDGLMDIFLLSEEHMEIKIGDITFD